MQQQADLALLLSFHRVERVFNEVAQRGDQHRDLLFTCGIRYLAFIRQRQGDARFFRPVDFTQQEPGNHRGFYLALYRTDIRLVMMCRLENVLFQLVVALNIQQAEYHMQFIHKLVGVGAQGIDVVNHAVQTLHQLADFRFITEGGDGADHPILTFHGDHVAQQ